MTLAHDLERWATERPDHRAVAFQGATWSWSVLNDRAARIAGGMRDLGVSPGDRVAVIALNSADNVATVCGIHRLGAVHVAINVQLKPKEMAYILRDSGTSVVVVSPRFKAALTEVARELPELKQIVVFDAEPDPAPEGQWPGSVLRAGLSELLDSESVPPSDAAPSDIVAISYTSGTTGVPKGAMLSHEALRFPLEVMTAMFGVTPEDCNATFLPMYSLSILMTGPLWSIYSGAPVALLEKWEPAEFGRLVIENNVTFVGGTSPIAFYDLARLPEEEAAAIDLGTIRFAICGGSPMVASLRNRFESRYGLRFIHAFGGTEGPGLITCDPVDEERKFDSVGKPLPHVRVRIVDDDWNDLPAREIGEIVSAPRTEGRYKGRYTPMSGYLNKAEETERVLRDRAFRWGDLGYLDEDGYLYLVDRKKDMIIRGGMNVYPSEIEQVLNSDERVDECAVVASPHERYTEVPKAFIMLRPGTEATVDEFRALVEEQLARYKWPHEYEIVADFPRNHMGKILKRELRAQEWARTSVSE